MPKTISDEDCNAQGTFYFPVGFHNETQYIAFWDAVAIPDSALEKLLSEQAPIQSTDSLGALRELLSEQAPSERTILEVNRAAARQNRELLRRIEKISPGHAASRIRARLSEVEARIRESEERLGIHRSGEPDEFLTQILARPVARATGLVTYLPADLDVTTRDRILDHEFELGDGRWMGARDIVDRFKTLGLDFLRPR